jgi:hypothetical protein
VTNEAALQAEVASVLRAGLPGLLVSCEVRVSHGRYDILFSFARRLVLELKVQGVASDVERQAQRYAMMPRVDGVMVVTTSQRLARQLLQCAAADQPTMLGGKPFDVVALRTIF